jgi:hypothetical protein
VPGRAPVDLGGPPGARAAAAGRPAVLDVEQPVGHEPVEVELGDVVRDADARRRLFPADRPVLGDDVAVQLPADRLAERRDAGDVGREVLGHSHLRCSSTTLTNRHVDEMSSPL